MIYVPGLRILIRSDLGVLKGSGSGFFLDGWIRIRFFSERSVPDPFFSEGSDPDQVFFLTVGSGSVFSERSVPDPGFFSERSDPDPGPLHLDPQLCLDLYRKYILIILTFISKEKI